MGKKCQKGQQGFTKGSKSDHSYHNLDRRSYLAKKKSSFTPSQPLTPAPINASLDRAAKANSHPPIVDGSDSDRSDSDSDSDEYIPSISDSVRRTAILYHYLHVLECPDRHDRDE